MKKASTALTVALLITTGQPALAEDPPQVPRPPGVIQIGYGTDGQPIYGPAPSTDTGAPIATPTNPAPGGTQPPQVERPSDVIIIGTTAEGYPIWGPKDPIAPFVPPLFNPDGTVYGSDPVLRIPGATDEHPFGFRQDGTPVPDPLFNPDGTPYVRGVSPIPVPQRITGAPFGYDSTGSPVPPPLWNPDGTPYVHGVSPMPFIPANLRQPIAITDESMQNLVDTEFTNAEIVAKKTKKGYLLDTDDQISYVDKTLTIVATKKGAKSKTLTLSVGSKGELLVPTGMTLKGYQLLIKRGSTVLKAIKLTK